MIYSVALTSDLDSKARSHLLRHDGQEDLCFALWSQSTGAHRKTAIIVELILPEEGERIVHGNVAFLPSYLERALGIALEKEMGLAFMHSHPSDGWQGMSQDDVDTEKSTAVAAKGATGLPLVGLTLGTDGAWSSRFWEKSAPSTYDRRWCATTRVVGDEMRITFADHLLPPPRFRERLRRTVSAWGEEKQRDLARFTFGIVGAGSVGSIVAESLARMGIVHIKLIDFDIVEEVNLDRLLNVTEPDIGLPKIRVIAKALRRSSTADGFFVEEIPFSIVEENGFKEGLDCDILFSCVDRPWPRSVLNLIAFAHLIPVIDGGISIQTLANGKLQGADWKAHIVSPSRRCLECVGQYDPSDVQLEREGYLDDPSYIQTLREDHHLRRNENVFVFSTNLASLEVLQMLSMVIAPLGISNNGEFLYHFVTGTLETTSDKTCAQNCIYQGIIGTGDKCPYDVGGKHSRAEEIRGRYPRSNILSRILKFFRAR
jgi:molybdopterin/thiamine biosynthesis adenylyltransferase